MIPRNGGIIYHVLVISVSDIIKGVDIGDIWGIYR